MLGQNQGDSCAKVPLLAVEVSKPDGSFLLSTEGEAPALDRSQQGLHSSQSVWQVCSLEIDVEAMLVEMSSSTQQSSFCSEVNANGCLR